MSKNHFSNKVKEDCYERAERACENCGVMVNLDGPHHVFFKSHYHKSDRNDLWNAALLCRICHNRVHNPSNKKEKNYDKQLKKKAIERAIEEGVETLHVAELKATLRSRHGL